MIHAEPSAFCSCCRPPVVPRAAIPQATVDLVRAFQGLFRPDTETWRGPHSGLEDALVPHGKTVALSNSLLLHYPYFVYVERWKSFLFYSDIRRANMALRAVWMLDHKMISLNNYHKRLGICFGYTNEQIYNFINTGPNPVLMERARRLRHGVQES